VAHVLLFHHALGLTDGVRAFADDLRAAGHEVTVPDLFDGRTFTTLDDGVAHAEEVGFLAVAERGGQVADRLPPDLVYAGFSLGVLPAQRAAQVRPGARAAVLYHSGVPLETFGERWPAGVPLQLHVAEADPWGDVEDVRQLAVDADAELFTYPGDAHLFTDRSLDVYDPVAAALVLERTLELLARLDGGG
jgi:dienelactone hydrolase